MRACDQPQVHATAARSKRLAHRILDLLPRDGLLEALEHVGLVLQPYNDHAADRRLNRLDSGNFRRDGCRRRKHRDQQIRAMDFHNPSERHAQRQLQYARIPRGGDSHEVRAVLRCRRVVEIDPVQRIEHLEA